jgi:hypothetical protein
MMKKETIKWYERWEKKRVLLYKKENQFIIEYFEKFDIRNHKIDQIGISSSFIYCKINWNS